MKMRDIHFEVLEMMERIRSKVEFWYGTRIREAPQSKILRLREGYIFLGAEDYVWVPICPVGVSANKTKAVGVVFKVENGEVGESWVELVVPKLYGKLDPAAVSQLNKLTTMYKFKRDDLTGQYYDRYRLTLVNSGKTTATILNQSETLLVGVIQGIVNTLKGCKIQTRPYSLVYDRKMMHGSITKLLAGRKGLKDSTNLRLEKLLNAI